MERERVAEGARVGAEDGDVAAAVQQCPQSHPSVPWPHAATGVSVSRQQAPSAPQKSGHAPATSPQLIQQPEPSFSTARAGDAVGVAKDANGAAVGAAVGAGVGP